MNMSITEILDELPKLKLGDRWAVWRRLSELEVDDEITPTPEMLAAIDEGLRSADTEPRYTVDEIHQKIEQCARRSK